MFRFGPSGEDVSVWILLELHGRKIDIAVRINRSRDLFFPPRGGNKEVGVLGICAVVSVRISKYTGGKEKRRESGRVEKKHSSAAFMKKRTAAIFEHEPLRDCPALCPALPRNLARDFSPAFI